jgi:DNA polymerase I-like protein with 3'-5' exonuclease and polymerase domains
LLVFDIESDGLLDTISKVHCINIINKVTGEELRFSDHSTYLNTDGTDSGIATQRNGTINDALWMLHNAESVAGQNIVGYDIPALKIVYPSWAGITGRIYDTKIMSQLLFPNLKDKDFAALAKRKLPEDFKKRGLIGTHKLESWGLRLGGELKADFNPKDYGHTWASMPFTQEMDNYCMQDVRTNVHILKYFLSLGISLDALYLEQRVAAILIRQETYGWCFDEEKAHKLVAELQGMRAELEEQCREAFHPWYAPDGKRGGLFTPKRDNKRMGYLKGVELGKIKLVEFNPGSRDHISNRLMAIHGWKPTEYTKEGKPKVDETILSSLPYPEAKLLTQYLTVQKRLGQIAEGNKAWLKYVKDGRIHGRINPMGTVTRRMSHYNPNIAQVPANRAPYGAACRSLFRASPGKVLVGCDADGLELRCKGHFMARWDDGAFAEAVVSGKKEDGSDQHTINQKLIGLHSRDSAKTWYYAFIYGAQDYKLGTIIVEDFPDEKQLRFYSKYPSGPKRDRAYQRLGKRSRDRMMAGLPAMARFIEAVQKAASRGWLKSLDGSRLLVRSQHSALNTLLQSAGAIVMKKALVIMDDLFQTDLKLTPGQDYEFVGNIHDEVQIETTEEHAEDIGRSAAESIRLAGEHFNFRCPLAGNYAIGKTWAETH